MRKSVQLLLSILMMTLLVAAPLSGVSAAPEEEGVPVFSVGDMPAFERWVLQNLAFSADSYKEGAVMRVSLSFTVTRKGGIKDVSILRAEDLWVTAQVLDVVANASRWEPKVVKGKPVASSEKLDLHFEMAKIPEADPAMLYAVDRKGTAEEGIDEVVSMVNVDKMPRFLGGDLRNFHKWVHANVKYPLDAMERRIEGRVVVGFVVTKDGSVTAAEVLQSDDDLLSQAAIEIIESSPRWSPAEQRGIPVSVRFSIPIDFKLTRAKK